MIPAARVVRLATREIMTYRLRSALLVVSVAAAVAAMTVVTQLGVAAEEAVADDVLRSQGLAGTYAVTASSGSPLPGVLASTSAEGVDRATGRVVELAGGAVADVGADREPAGLTIHAVDPGVVDSVPAEVLAGRWLDAEDATNGMVPIVLSDRTAAMLWPDAELADAVGRTLRLTYPAPTYVTVVGVVGDGPLLRFTDGGGFVPLAETGLPEQLTGWAGHLDSSSAGVRLFLTTGADGPAPAEQAMATVRSRLATDGVVAQVDVQRIDSADDFDGSAALLSAVMRTIGLVVLTVGVMTVATVSMTSLRERSGELALRRAMGASPRSLGALVLTENVMIVGAGAALGVVLVVTGSHAVAAWVVENQETTAMTRIDVGTALTALTATGVLGTLVGLLPARRAARQGVMDVLAS